MKKILLFGFAIALGIFALNANAGEIQGKIVGKKGDMVHVQPANTTTPTELKMTDKTKYFEKTEKKSAESAEIDVNEFVEVIYSIDEKTNEPIIDEIIVVDYID